MEAGLEAEPVLLSRLAGGRRLFQCLKQAVNRISVSITLTEMLSADFIFCTFLL